MADFGDVWGAANEGTQANENMFNNYIYNQAQNALVGAYGPMAGNPTGALQMQQYNYLGQQDPQLLQAQNIQNQTNAGLIQPTIDTASANARTAGANADVSQGSVGSAIQTNAANASTATSNAVVNQQGANNALIQRNAGLLAGLGASIKSKIASGMPADQAFDSTASVMSRMPGLQMDPGELAAIRQHVINDPNSIDQFTAMMNQVKMGSLAPTDAMKLLETQWGIQQKQQDINQSIATTAKTNQDSANAAYQTYTQAQQREQGMRDRINALPVVASRAAAAQTAIANARQLINGMSDNTVGNWLTSHIQGTRTSQLDDYFDQIEHNMALSDLSGMREQGTTMGRTTNTEFSAAGGALAKLEPNMSKAQLLQQLDLADKQTTLAQQGLSDQQKYMQEQYGPIAAERRSAQSRWQSLQSQLPGAAGQPTPAGQSTPTGQPTPAGATPSAPAQAPAGGASAPPAGQTFAPYGGHLMVPGNAASSSALPVSPAAAAGMSKVDPTFAANMERFRTDLRDKHGINTMVISSYRDPQLQSRLYANYQARQAGQPLPYPQEGNGGMAAPPGRSMHNFGLAMDMIPLDANGHPDYSNGKAQAQINQLAESYGIYPGSRFGDYDHYQAGPPGSIPGAPSGKPVNEATAPEVPTPPSRPLRTPASVASAAPTPPVRPSQQVAGNVPPMPGGPAPQGQGAPIRQPIPTNPGGPAPQPPGQPVYRPIAAAAPNANLRTAAAAPRRSAPPPPQQVASATPPAQQPTPFTAPTPAALPQANMTPFASSAPSPLPQQSSAAASAMSRPTAPAVTPHHPAALGPPLQAPRQQPPLIIAGTTNQQGGESGGRQQGASALPPRTEVMAGRALLAKYLRA